MMKTIYFILSFLLSLRPVHAQKVGLVLSGGGAEGLSRIGIIRALEENDLRIVCCSLNGRQLSGSSMLWDTLPTIWKKVIKSDDFKRWYTGI